MTNVSFENIHLPAATHYGLRHYQLRPDQCFSIDDHFHLMYELMWFRDISASVTIQERSYSLRANSLLFVPSLMVHRMKTEAKRQDFFLLQYEAGLYADLDLLPQQQPMLLPLITELEERDAERMNHLTGWLEQVEEGPQQLLLKQSLMRTLLLFVAQLQHQQRHLQSSEFSGHRAQSGMNKVFPLLQRLESDPKLQISLDDAASYCGMSRYHFSRTFKTLLGQNFKDYLLKRKISAAVGLLINTELTIAEIAYQCEFTDSAYFCAKFKQQMGQTPRQFRNGVLQANEFATSE
ncbi:hypothetical protein GCM10011369_06200 [Neiella marina]|uniref:HTH araC/xylS-type domain-containing protein n=1 Tax=Neiella marina TaxID=508461 RepID=A0A8J2XNC3_9GAMM|nr:helix-turn-helix transcriptional regulator [Neiella marina]GGA67296.1 hypothetical protein GCM10011369_06200 [Neiella marina]